MKKLRGSDLNSLAYEMIYDRSNIKSNVHFCMSLDNHMQLNV
jgi:hypothetical protein